MWPYPWTHVGTPSHLGHMDRVAATMPSQAHAGAAQEAPDIGQWEGQDVPLVRPSSDAFPWGAGHGTLRWTRASEQAGKALRSQGHQCAHVM